MFGKFKQSKFGAWLDNYWYHYKWRTLIIGGFAIILIVCIVQSFGSESYDVSVLYAGPYIMSESELKSASDALRSCMSSDYDGNGKKAVGFVGMGIMNDEQLDDALEVYGDSSYYSLHSNYSYDAMLTKFYSEAYTGESLVSFLDEGLYLLLLEKDALYPLSEALGTSPENAFSDYGIRLCDTEFGSFFTVFSTLPENTVVCLRKPTAASSFRGKKAEEERYDSSTAILRDIMTFKAPEE